MTVSSVFRKGLNVLVPSAPAETTVAETLISEEATITARPEDDFRVEPMVSEGDWVEQGAPVLRSRRHFAMQVTAPMPGRVARIELGPGHRLSSIQFFLEAGAGRYKRETHLANRGDDPGALRDLLLNSGLWRAIRSRPFGRVPPPGEQPSAIFVMALDTRPLAPDPRAAVEDRVEAVEHGLRALLRLTGGKVFLCQDRGAPLVAAKVVSDRLRLVKSKKIHPWGLAGFQIHHHHPARTDRPVWDIHVEDVAAIGSLLATGLVPRTRLVSIAGPALRAARNLRCQPGADLRQLIHGFVKPGPHSIISGSALDGREARWLRPRDRQVTVLGVTPSPPSPHWFLSALQTASRPAPLIPTAAVDQAMGGGLPTMSFLRALSSGDAETFMRLGGLSLLKEDVALVDYLTRAEPSISGYLGQMMHRISVESVE